MKNERGSVVGISPQWGKMTDDALLFVADARTNRDCWLELSGGDTLELLPKSEVYLSFNEFRKAKKQT